MTESMATGKETVDDIIAHYGVKGMRWGVRRARGKDDVASSPRKGPREISKDAAEAKALRAKVKSKGLDALSNDEVRALTNRLSLEQQYARMTSSQAPKTKRTAKKVIGRVLASQGNLAVSTVATAVTTAQVAKAMSKSKTMTKLTTK